MTRLSLAVLALALVAMPASAAGISGSYIEARTCDVWTGPCFANAEVNLGGKHAVLGWKIDKGSLDNVSLDGLGVVAVVEASDTLGVAQAGQAKAVLIVDRRASSTQRDALVRLARSQAGALLRNVVSVQSGAIDLKACPCKNDACAVLNAGVAKIETRCIDGEHDKICGNESAFYPPLAKNVKVKAAVAVENCFNGKGIDQSWKQSGRRSAYVGSFELR
ncbi:MAG: DUF1326 domain-containing protein [Planctomycetes bacterium]|nr:DUF1326 domain-containing protein [Planctomycetota bacterium]